jgi:hypothetical protein
MDCKNCELLFEELAGATRQHIQQLGRLRIAALQHDRDATQQLQNAVDALQAQREQALTAYRTHRIGHWSARPDAPPVDGSGAEPKA